MSKNDDTSLRVKESIGYYDLKIQFTPKEDAPENSANGKAADCFTATVDYVNRLKAIMSKCEKEQCNEQESLEEEEDFTDLVDWTKGEWVSAKKYITANGGEEKTLKNYRETKNRPEQSRKKPTIWRDKAGNIYELKEGRKVNSSPPYFLRNTADSH
jgi:hypothetical protein